MGWWLSGHTRHGALTRLDQRIHNYICMYLYKKFWAAVSLLGEESNGWSSDQSKRQGAPDRDSSLRVANLSQVNDGRRLAASPRYGGQSDNRLGATTPAWIGAKRSHLENWMDGHGKMHGPWSEPANFMTNCLSILAVLPHESWPVTTHCGEMKHSRTLPA
jgi:hypothetical protein